MTLITATRLTCSLLTLGMYWAISGSIFVALANGSDLLGAWLFGGTLIFLAGWLVVGLPLVARGDRVSSLKYLPVITIASGIAGSLMLSVPDLLIRAMDRRHQGVTTPNVKNRTLATLHTAGQTDEKRVYKY